MIDRTIAIDASSLVSVFIHSTWPKGEIEGDGDGRVIWNTIRAVTKMVNQLEPMNVVICGDHGSRETRIRREILPQYKAHREHKPKHERERQRFLKICRKFLPVRVLYKEGFEADDLLAYVTKMDVEKDRQVVIVSKDRDLLQLQQMYPNNVSCYDPTGKGYLELPHPDVNFIWLKALTGDPSDNIPSVTGEKTALKLLRGEYKQSLKEYLHDGETRSEKLPRIDVFKRNIRLVTLLGKGALIEPIEFEDHPKEYVFDSHILKKVLQVLAEDPDSPENDAIARTWDAFLGKRSMKGSQQGVVDWAQRRANRQQNQVAGQVFY
jgi:5'-3' exonuclease